MFVLSMAVLLVVSQIELSTLMQQERQWAAVAAARKAARQAAANAHGKPQCRLVASEQLLCYYPCKLLNVNVV
jgi:hypothetical protein